MRRCPIRALFAVAAALALAGCTGHPQRKDSDVRVAIYGNPSSFSLIGNTDLNSIQLAHVISDGLVAYDAQGQYIPMVARSWELAPDGKTLTFHLREGVLWHDGAPSELGRCRVHRQESPGPRRPGDVMRSSSFANVASVETPDDLTVVVHFTGPYADFLEPWRVPLVPEHVASKDADFLGGAFAHHPIGCGPFRFVSQSPGQSVVLEAFDKYWGGRPAMDRLIIKIVTAERTGLRVAPAGRARHARGHSRSLARVADRTRREAARAIRLLPPQRVAGRTGTSTTAHRSSTTSGCAARCFWPWTASASRRPSPRGSPAPACRATRRSRCGPIRRSSRSRSTPRRARASSMRPDGGSLHPGGLRAKDGRPFEFTLIFAAGSQEIADRIAAWMQQSSPTSASG